MTFYLRLSVSTPRSVATACEVSLFTSALPGSSLCLLVCLCVLLAGVLLGFSGSGCSSGWIVAVSFPGLVLCQWAERPCACCPGLLAGCSCFLPGGRFPFCWLCLGLRVSSPSFHSPRPESLSLSLSRPFLLQPLAPGVFLVGACVCLGYFRSLDCPSPSLGGLPIGIPAFLSGSLPVALSHLPGGVQLFASLDALPVRSSGLSGAFVALPGSLLCILLGFRSLSSQFPVVGLMLCFLSCGPSPGLSLFGLLAVPPFLLSRFVAVCFPVLWVSLFPGCLPRPGLLFPGSRNLQLPPPWYWRWHLDPAFCSSGVLHPTLSHVWSLVSVSWGGFSDCSVGSKVFSLPFLILFSVALSPV